MVLPRWWPHILLCGILTSVENAVGVESVFSFTEKRMEYYRNKTRDIFFHAYDNYVNFAYPFDELKPISCEGMDTWGSFSLSLIDALDMLIVMGHYSEFKRAVNILIREFNTTADVNVSVFETNIRVVGGLLSAHLLSREAGPEFQKGWPCEGPLLRLAEKVARRLLPAFDTVTGMPYGTVNLQHGVCKNETPITCTASIGTFLLEFGTLSHLTGDPVYENVALNALKQLWKHRSSIGLVGNHINIQTSAWTATDAGIGGGVDSYFEYLVKGGALFGRRLLIEQFLEYRTVIDRYMRHNDWFPWVSMYSGHLSMAIFQSLEAFWPGLLTLVGDIEAAHRILLNYKIILNQYGMTPEFYNLQRMEAHDIRMGYPLRPELAESLMYMYRATEDPQLLRMGASIVEAIERGSKTNCGFATVANVLDHSIEDRMESFFLAETTKYLYLLFDPSNPLHDISLPKLVVDGPKGECLLNRGGQIFNTEAHPMDASANNCCGLKFDQAVRELDALRDDLDLTTLIPLNDERWFRQAFSPEDARKGPTVKKCRINMHPMLQPGKYRLSTRMQRKLNRLFPRVPDRLRLSGDITVWRSRLPIGGLSETAQFLIIKSCREEPLDEGSSGHCYAIDRLRSPVNMYTASSIKDQNGNEQCSAERAEAIFKSKSNETCSVKPAKVASEAWPLPPNAAAQNRTVIRMRHVRDFFPKLHALQCHWLSKVTDSTNDLVYPELSYFGLCPTASSFKFMPYDVIPSSFTEFCDAGPFLRRFSISGEIIA